jgi:flagellar motor protein MotB
LTVEQDRPKQHKQEEDSMKRHFAKGLTMLMLVIGLALASAAVANGQSGQQVTAQIPFEFNVADQTMSSGQYQLNRANSAGDVLEIRSTAGKGRTMRLTSPVIANNQQDRNAKLVFHRYGSTYFLSQVWLDGRTTGREFAKSKQERAAETELKKIARYHGDLKPVYEVVEVMVTAR